MSSIDALSADSAALLAEARANEKIRLLEVHKRRLRWAVKALLKRAGDPDPIGPKERAVYEAILQEVE